MEPTPVRLLWAFPLFCHPMSNDAPIATFSFSLSSFHKFLSLSKLSRHDSFANFSIWGLTSLSQAFSVDSPSDGTLINDNNSFTWAGPMPTCSIPAANFVLTSKIGLPRGVPMLRWVLFVRQIFVSPHSEFEQHM